MIWNLWHSRLHVALGAAVWAADLFNAWNFGHLPYVSFDYDSLLAGNCANLRAKCHCRKVGEKTSRSRPEEGDKPCHFLIEPTRGGCSLAIMNCENVLDVSASGPF